MIRCRWPLSVRVLCGLFVFAAGCQRAEIESYEVPKPTFTLGNSGSGGTGEAKRMLAAMFPAGDTVWYFRLTGPAPAVEEQESAFDRFLTSLKFKGDELDFETPPGWKQEGGKTEFRYATLRSGPMELRISKLRNMGEAAVVLPNINRWRGELGLPPWRDSELANESKEVTADGVKGVRVAFTGQGGGGMDMGKMPPFAKSPPAKSPPAKSPPAKAGGAGPLAYSVPPSWQDLGPKEGIVRSVATFRTPGGELTVTPLPGDAGGLASNVNRWRGQVGLPPASDAELAASLKPIEIDGSRGQLVDLDGKDGKRTLGAIVERRGTTWFFKLTGPRDALGSQLANFEAFLKSVRFEGGS